MRYHIDTIPVWDAYKQGSECPLCDLRAASEQAYLESFLGASVMEPAVRIEVNQKGFCQRHFAQMLHMKNHLGLALMTHTHLKETMGRLKPAAPMKNHLPRGKKTVSEADGACILCDRLSHTMNRYLYTVLYLWERDADFKKAFTASKGLCLPHYRSLAAMAAQEFSPAEARAFLSSLEILQQENMARIEKELEWFTQKFDYRNSCKPWGNSKDAPERAIWKLRGR